MTTNTRPLILNLAPTGMVPTRAMSRHVPLQPDEIIRDVLRVAEIGCTIVHLHARAEDGEPTHRKEVFARIIGGIREKRQDLVLCVTCSGRNAKELSDRSQVLELEGDLKPDMASLTLSSLNFPGQASVNAPETVKALALRMLEHGIKPELEIFDLGMVNIFNYLASREILHPPYYANLLFGNVASAQADFLEIGALVSKLPEGTLWGLAGLGAMQLPVAAMAVAAAPAVRIGLEDNLWLDAGRTQLASNLELAERVHSLARVLGREIMRPEQLRTELRLRNFT
jgi:3-keto-5-aminohexanoate cleavage enzyme